MPAARMRLRTSRERCRLASADSDGYMPRLAPSGEANLRAILAGAIEPTHVPPFPAPLVSNSAYRSFTRVSRKSANPGDCFRSTVTTTRCALEETLASFSPPALDQASVLDLGAPGLRAAKTALKRSS